MDTDVAVIGGGPAGLAAAKEAASLGAQVMLIEQDKPGGRALWHSLVPSKVWLHAANLLGTFSAAEEFGLTRASVSDNPAALLERLRKVKAREQEKDNAHFTMLGIEVVAGTAQFVDDHTLQITRNGGQTRFIRANAVILASGSVPIFPPDLKPDGQRILAPRFLSTLETIPGSIIIIGGGVTGSEVLYLFNRLGSEVTAITDIEDLLPRSDHDISQRLESILEQRGVVFHKGVPVRSIENVGDDVEVYREDDRKFTAEYAFVAIGRKPDTTKLHLNATSVEVRPDGGVGVNDQCQTSVQHIYAAGDITGGPMLANRAAAQGRIAARTAVQGREHSYHPDWTVEVVYTQPEVAQVGLTESRAKDQGRDISIKKAEYSQNLKANISGHREGFLKIILDQGSGILQGAAAIGDHAGDLLTPISVAIRAGLSLDELSEIAPGNPTLSELIIELS